jgi:hypothetical protein
MVKLADGLNVPFSELTNGRAVDPETGQTVQLTQVGSTNTYRQVLTRSDGKNITYFVDKPTDIVVTVSEN